MNYVTQILELRNTMQKEIVRKVVSKSIESDRTMEFNIPQDFVIEDETGYPVKITLVGVECNTGNLFDDNNNIISYQHVPVEILCVIHHIVIESEKYIFKPIMFI
jgi:hypothetical protein